MRPLHDRVLIRPVEVSRQTSGGLYLPDSARTPSQVMGVVVELGEGPVTAKGVRLPHLVEVGQTVLFPAEAGFEIDLDDGTYLILRETELLAVVE